MSDDYGELYGSQLDDVLETAAAERHAATAGFAVGDRVGPKLNDCYGKVTWIGGCSMRDHPWCAEHCCNVEMECMNMAHYHYMSRRTRFPADELEHID